MTGVIIFMFAAVIGSFLNVCIYRMPKKESLITPGSHCPKCRHPVRWYHNIPIASYILLGGKCAYCGEKISPRYIIVEAITVVMVLGLYAAFGTTTKFFSYSILTCALIVATFVDLAIYEIPDSVSIGGMIAGILMAVLFPSVFDVNSSFAGFVKAVLGIITGGGAIYLMGLAGGAVFKKEAMGGGDVKLMAAIGSFIGWKLALLTFFIAPFFGAILGIIIKLKEKKDIIPYGPFLSLGAIIAIFFGDKILSTLFFGL